MAASFLLNPARAPRLNAAGYPIKKKYTVYGWLRNEMKPHTFASGKTVINGAVRQKSGNWQDFTINPTNMAKVQAAIAEGTLDTSKPVTLWGEFYQTSKGKRVMEVLSIQNALSDAEFKARNEARRAAPASEDYVTPKLHHTIWNERLYPYDDITILKDPGSPLSTNQAEIGFYIGGHVDRDGTVMATYRTWIGGNKILPISHLRAERGAYTPKTGDIIHVHPSAGYVSNDARGQCHVIHQVQHLNDRGDVFTIHTIHGDEHVTPSQCTLVTRNN